MQALRNSLLSGTFHRQWRQFTWSIRWAAWPCRFTFRRS